ncbi:sterol esterase [Pichia kluyveri]|uniref:Sterol esterase n=1 Tax=Pichia kluyveri TaxID=36015 RepID=A0AAV5R828_PICKL|nr:sterol esterase [Pichia kluyveri]
MISPMTTPKRRTHRKSVSEQVENINASPINLSQRNILNALTEINNENGDESVVENDNMKRDGTDDANIRYANIEENTNIIENERISTLQKVENAISISLIILEQIISSITILLPKSIINICTMLSKFIFTFFKTNNEKYNEFINETDNEKLGDEVLHKVEQLRNFESFQKIAELNGFISESHLVPTQDGFKLTIHRLDPTKNGFKSNNRAVYFQHGLLMTSDVWCVMFNKDDNLPFRLCELGFDVFLGNNRGNKYSNKHEKYNPNDVEFWNFSIDEFAMYDIPSSINYILNLKNIEKLIYIGFSQGCSQILSSVSINDDLNNKIEKLILIAPATTPKKLSNWLINSIINFDPELIYKLFGKKILMKSVLFWRNITYPPMFIKLIDLPNDLLFNWKSKNIDIIQKLISYYHLYSTTSVKCVVHWFQIIKSKKFQMYQERDYFQPFEYPTSETIKISKILIIYGMNDSLVDIDILINQLPEFNNQTITQIKDGKIVGKKKIYDNVEVIIENDDDEEYGYGDNNSETEVIKVNSSDKLNELRVFGINGYEHLDLLWGKNMNENVIQNVIEFL